MDAIPINLQLTVDKVMQQGPQAFSLFMKHKTKCPGCHMQQFCTLNDVATTYDLSLETLLDEIKKISSQS